MELTAFRFSAEFSLALCFCFMVGNCEPLHIRAMIRAAAFKRDYVIYLITGTRAFCLARRWARVREHKIGAGFSIARGESVKREAENKKNAKEKFHRRNNN
jgi:hypothetical protein